MTVLLEIESRDRAASWAEAALSDMRRLDIPQRPHNFAIWYEYHSQRNLALNRRIDELLVQRRPFDEEVAGKLYADFFGNGSEEKAVRETTRRVRSILGEVLKVASTARAAAGQHGATLRAIGTEIAYPSAVNRIADLVARAVSAIQAIEVHNEALGDRLRSTVREIDFLRQDLERVRHEALTDSLTGAANRKALESALADALKHCEETDEALALLIVDIDHFKTFNDNWGHPIGDHVLRLVADTVTAKIRGQDMVARLGGDEFAVMLLQTNGAGAATVAQTLRSAMSTHALVNRRTGEKLGHITLSIGIAERRPGDFVAEIMQRADAALYLAKRGGRDRVVGESQLPAAGK
jgi:diguanylate cyclase